MKIDDVRIDDKGMRWVTLRMPAGLVEQLDRRAIDEDRSRSAVVRRSVEKTLSVEERA